MFGIRRRRHIVLPVDELVPSPRHLVARGELTIGRAGRGIRPSGALYVASVFMRTPRGACADPIARVEGNSRLDRARVQFLAQMPGEAGWQKPVRGRG